MAKATDFCEISRARGRKGAREGGFGGVPVPFERSTPAR
jgi:hypothetical protein